MKKKHIGCVVIGIFLVCITHIIKVDAASGTAQDPYLIHDCTELQNIKNNLSASYALANHIDCSDSVNWNTGKGFEPIGTTKNSFLGTLDGNDYRIDNLTISRASDNFVGVFGYTGASSSIKNLSIQHAKIVGANYVGTLVGGVYKTTVDNVKITTDVKGTDNIGGLIGAANTSTLKNIKVLADVKGGSSTGGVVGFSTGTTGKNIISNGFIFGTDNVGGVTGWLYQNSVFSESYSLATVKGNNFVGGFGGILNTSSIVENSYAKGYVFGSVARAGGLIGDVNIAGTVRNSYSAGLVKGVSEVGGLIGRDSGSGYEYNSHWDIDTSKQNVSAKGTGHMTSDMKKQSIYTSWDFTNIWKMDTAINTGYPILRSFTYESTTPNDISNLAAKSKTSTSISLQWNNPIDVNFHKIRIFRDGTFLDEVRGSEFTDSGLQNGKVYTYLLVAVDVNGNESLGKSIQVEASDIGELFVTVPKANDFGTIKLDGLPKKITTGFSGMITVGDETKSGNGWNVTVQATPFKEIGGNGISLPSGSLVLREPNQMNVKSGDAVKLPTIQNGGPWVIDGGTAVKLIHAKPTEAMGSYEIGFPSDALELTLQPEIIQVDRENYPLGTPYTSTITFTVVSGP